MSGKLTSLKHRDIAAEMPLSRKQTADFLTKLKTVPIDGSNELLYVPLDVVRGDDGAASTDVLWRTLVNTDEACVLFSGFPGSGKTTELKRLRERLERTVDPAVAKPDDDPFPTEVVFVDGEQFFDLFNPVGIADVLRVIAFRMDEEANRVETGKPDPKKGFLPQFVDFLKNTKVDFLGKIDFGQYLGGGVNLMLEIKNSPSFRDAAREAIAQRGQAFLDLARASMTHSIERMRKAKKNKYLRVVVMVDGLDKVQPIQERDRDAIEKGVELLYVTQASQLRIPCHVVYTFPLWLKYRFAMWNAYDAPPLVLPMVKVCDRQTHADHEEGIQKLIEVLRRRIDLDAVFGSASSESLRRLVRASGGYLRDLVRLVRDVVLMGKDFPVSADFVDRTIARVKQEYVHTLLGTDLDVLAEVATTREPPQDSGGKMAAFARLYEKRLILAYRNGDEWYDVHPIIREEPRIQQRIAERYPKA